MNKLRVVVLTFLAVGNLGAQLITLEPDNYTDGTVLNHVLPQVGLVTAASNNVPIPFDVTARTSPAQPFLPPTGPNVFAHVGIPFFNVDRKLRMDFNGLVSYVGITFQGGNNLETERGQLDVFGIGGNLLRSYVTQPLLGGQSEVMSITELVPDISWATAYTVAGDNPFGRLDYLTFSTPVPEPSSLALFALAGGAILYCARLRHAGTSCFWLRLLFGTSRIRNPS
jgi:hypothetical protein